MEEHIKNAKVAATALITAMTALWGWFGWMVVAWVCCMAADYLSGSAAAIKAGKWSSKAAREGIWHKAGAVIVVGVSALCDWLLGLALGNLPAVELPFTYTVLICPVVVAWYTLTELGSIMENAVAMGAPVPAWLPRILALGKDAVDTAGDKLTKD